MQTQLTCSIPGCNKPCKMRFNVSRRERWCSMHYERWRRTGTTDPRPRRYCEQPDCGKPHVARGMCASHYTRWKTTHPGSSSCSIEGCGRPTFGRGWCRMHWKRWRKHGDPLVSLINRNPDRAARFWPNVDTSGGPDACWPWTGDTDQKGYGLFYFQGRTRAHRAAYELAMGEPIPAGLDGCHSCDNPPCCNPAHLWLGTNAENMADMVAKGRQGDRTKAYCKRGHEFTPENTYLKPSRSKSAQPGQTRKTCRECSLNQRWARKRGLSQETVRPQKRVRHCSAPGCQRQYWASGYCSPHYQRERRANRA